MITLGSLLVFLVVVGIVLTYVMIVHSFIKSGEKAEKEAVRLPRPESRHHDSHGHRAAA